MLEKSAFGEMPKEKADSSGKPGLGMTNFSVL
jgi:hypothetical protein